MLPHLWLIKYDVAYLIHWAGRQRTLYPGVTGRPATAAWRFTAAVTDRLWHATRRSKIAAAHGRRWN